MTIHFLLITLLNLGFGYILAKWLGRRRRFLERDRQWQELTAEVRACLEREAWHRNFQPQTAPLDAGTSIAEPPAAIAGPTTMADLAESPGIGLPNLASRSQLVQRLAQWWQQEPENARPIALGMVAVDQLQEITARCGAETSNQILTKLAEVVASAIRTTDVVGRSSASRVLIVFPDADANSAAIALERVRQTIEVTQFLKGPERITVSVTCSATERTAGDTPDDLVLRVEASLLNARRCGGNHTFVHDGSYPAPVRPPQISLEASVYPLGCAG